MLLVQQGTDDGETPPGFIGGCASLCTKARSSDDEVFTNTFDVTGCTGTGGCCQSPVTMISMPSEVQAKRLYSGSAAVEQKKHLPVNVFVVEEGWIDQFNWSVRADEVKEAPFILQWGVTWGLPQAPQNYDLCDDGVRRMLCKSEHSYCWTAFPAEGYTCGCEPGYQGNPYLPGGCQDMDECSLPAEKSGCFGECINTIGSMECRCPYGTFGNPGVEGGCFKINSTTTAHALLPTVAPAPNGLPDCNITTCGNVSVPYPFGFGPSHCYWPGLNLTCNTSYSPPRLLLDSKGILQVVDVSLHDSTVRVVHHTRIVDDDFTSDPDGTTKATSFQLPDIGESYMLSARNEFLFFGDGVQATLYGNKYRNGGSSSSITGCVANISSGPFQYRHCSGSDACCHAPILAGSSPKKMEFKGGVNSGLINDMPLAFISEEGLTKQWWDMILNGTYLLNMHIPRYFSSPLVLQWAVKQGFSVPADNSSAQCPGDVASQLCKSKDSGCRQENGGFTCHCNKGYQGNPYITDGCKDIDECNITATRCFGGICKNLPGKFKCQCKLGTFGNPYKPPGCVSLSTVLSKFITKNKIGLSAASGPVLLLAVLGIMLVPRKIEQHKMKILKQKHFKQNRGQLLQQLISQKADIAERMIIPLDELAKATNNFDKSRELGGGGHGTVYKGILSNLHVVAIKKSKITVQKEIDEFINEVAILSQINHKNVVKLFGCCLETEVPLLVYEFISNGTLYHHLHVEGPRSLSWGNRLRIATEIATSLAYLHSAVSTPIIHRDIKSSNILLDDTLTSKISDFGASRYIPMDKTGLTTRVQGTIGYLDPMYFCTSRLTEKSDVYSFGVILVELLTRKKPFSFLSTEGEGLVSHFLNLLDEGNLIQIIDPQVTEEGGEEVQEVAMLAASCINLRGEERPTMRLVEHTLEGLRGSKMYKSDDIVAVEFGDDRIVVSCPSSTKEGQRFEESSRRYSSEQEMIMSARYPR
ncbi:hypothetical protein GQ55_8G055100 [Panicum hallii var. hallii]|uniref:Protein kinase domain-containing protein n=1 Tax=Panicum hallii var. hallii TaxID=1504633 RepID=A0A2T7CL06_9POAL|nr:hypothetical protein GQ55_8G055100 [Panicum hallii var. hallii]